MQIFPRPVSGIIALGLCCALWLTPLVHAKEMREVRPEREGFSSARLARIDQQMQQAVADGVMVGGHGLIARNGQIVYNRTYGLRDRDAEQAMPEDAIYRIYSMTKPVTAVALMMLYEEGRFLLDEPIAKYLPELANLQVAVSTADGATTARSDGTQSMTEGEGDASALGETRAPRRQPTIRDLLMHTAGFTYGIFGRTEVDRLYREAQLQQGKRLDEFVAALGKLPLQYEPGTRWHYSVSVDVQGRLVEVLSGMSFGDYLQQKLFAPLGMIDTSFRFDPAKLERVATLYTQKGTREDFSAFLTPAASRELVPAGEFIDQDFQPDARFESGGGGLLSTTRDYLRFAQMLLNGGELDGVRILSPQTIDLMRSDHLGEIPMGRPGWGFGLGFGVLLNPGVAGDIGSAGEYNWGGAAGTRFWIDPEENLIGLFMVQSMPHRTTLARQFKVLTYQALLD